MKNLLLPILLVGFVSLAGCATSDGPDKDPNIIEEVFKGNGIPFEKAYVFRAVKVRWNDYSNSWIYKKIPNNKYWDGLIFAVIPYRSNLNQDTIKVLAYRCNSSDNPNSGWTYRQVPDWFRIP